MIGVFSETGTASVAGAAGNTTLAAGKFIYKITGTAAGLATTGTDLLTLLNGTITTQHAADRIYFAISDGTDVGVYYGTPGADTSLVAAEILLVAVVKNTTLASVTFDNFTFAS